MTCDLPSAVVTKRNPFGLSQHKLQAIIIVRYSIKADPVSIVDVVCLHALLHSRCSSCHSASGMVRPPSQQRLLTGGKQEGQKVLSGVVLHTAYIIPRTRLVPC
jgi:hypothetical protein